MAIKFRDEDGTTPITEEQFSCLECKDDYRLSDDEYDALDKILKDAGLDSIAVKEAEISGIKYDFIYDMEEGLLYNLKDGVALVADAVEVESSDDVIDLSVHYWKKLLTRLAITV